MRLKDYIENFCYIWRWADDGVGNGFYPGQAYLALSFVGPTQYELLYFFLFLLFQCLLCQ